MDAFFYSRDVNLHGKNDEDGERVITGQQFEVGYEIGGKRIKELAKEGKILNYEESRGKSYTFSIISDETNEKSRKTFITDKTIEGNK